ncbi:glucose dehydrogenase [Ochrobactrum sp. AN78]|nr:glucose dehydrogenase [Ochrobactrum sp. AN78]
MMVNAVLLASGIFLALGVATVIGMVLRRRLPPHHLNAESKDVIRLATAIVATLSALALGLLIASAKSDYDDAQRELASTAARIMLLDRLMAQYGSETREARQQLRDLVGVRLKQGWSVESAQLHPTGPEAVSLDIERVQKTLRALLPSRPTEALIKNRALEVSGTLAEAQWLRVESSDEGLPFGFLLVLIYWLALLFGTFGLQAPANPTVLTILVVCALSVAGAIFAIVDMANPYAGFIRISDAPLRTALTRLGNQVP